MATDLLNTDEAIARIRSHTADGGQILGIDGLEIVPQGIMGRIDLILDLSSHAITSSEAEAKAIEFVEANRADNILFDVVRDGPRDE